MGGGVGSEKALLREALRLYNHACLVPNVLIVRGAFDTIFFIDDALVMDVVYIRVQPKFFSGVNNE